MWFLTQTAIFRDIFLHTFFTATSGMKNCIFQSFCLCTQGNQTLINALVCMLCRKNIASNALFVVFMTRLCLIKIEGYDVFSTADSAMIKLISHSILHGSLHSETHSQTKKTLLWHCLCFYTQQKKSYKVKMLCVHGWFAPDICFRHISVIISGHPWFMYDFCILSKKVLLQHAKYISYSHMRAAAVSSKCGYLSYFKRC